MLVIVLIRELSEGVCDLSIRMQQLCFFMFLRPKLQYFNSDYTRKANLAVCLMSIAVLNNLRLI